MKSHFPLAYAFPIIFPFVNLSNSSWLLLYQTNLWGLFPSCPLCIIFPASVLFITPADRRKTFAFRRNCFSEPNAIQWAKKRSDRWRSIVKGLIQSTI